MENLSFYTAAAGGLLIGLSASLMLWLNGRITGISGILNGVLFARGRDKIWRFLFVLGLILGTMIVQWLLPNFNAPRLNYPLGLLVVGGFLVGFGTRMGNGCTSGHGVCGLARFSLRSLAATLTFIATAMFSVYLFRHLLGLAP